MTQIPEYQYFAKFKNENGEFEYKLNANSVEAADIQAETLAAAYDWELLSTFERIV